MKMGYDVKTLAVINALNRAHPQYLWWYAIDRICGIYEKRTFTSGLMYDVIDTLMVEGLLEKKELTYDETKGTIEALVAGGKIKPGDLIPPKKQRDSIGYRLTDEGIKEWSKQFTVEKTFGAGAVQSHATA